MIHVPELIKWNIGLTYTTKVNTVLRSVVGGKVNARMKVES